MHHQPYLAVTLTEGGSVAEIPFQAQYNGNIGAIQWLGHDDENQNLYKYYNDNMNRLMIQLRKQNPQILNAKQIRTSVIQVQSEEKVSLHLNQAPKTHRTRLAVLRHGYR